jgi:transcriptional regulator with XRE-family HTH domain
MTDIRTRRMNAGLTQHQLAQLSGTSKATIGYAERHPDRVIQATVNRIVEALIVVETSERDEQAAAKRAAAMVALPASPEREAFGDIFVARILDHLECGRVEQADALLEFIPQKASQELLDKFFDYGDAESVSIWED